MSERTYKLNLAFAVVDTIVSVEAILCFGLSAKFFGHWWINLFSFLPLLLFHAHPLVIESVGEEEQGDE